MIQKTMKRHLLTALCLVVSVSLFGKTPLAGTEGNCNSNIPGFSKDGHVYVDLGLSVKWATCNVGAETPDESGNYYSWGETEVKGVYANDTYKYGVIGIEGEVTTLTKYCTNKRNGKVDNKRTLLPEDDVASKEWGDGWRMPTAKEMQELLDRCKWEWTQLNGVNGYRVSGPSGNSIFLPACGFHGTRVMNGGRDGNYWTSSLGTGVPGYAQCLAFSSEYHVLYDDFDDNRDCGFSVRPVMP